MRRSPLVAIIVVVLALAACSSDDDDVGADATSTSTAVTTSTPDAGPTTTEPGSETADPDSTDPDDDGEAYRSEFYSVDDRWLCRPDLDDDVCDENYDLTVISADGTRVIEPFEPAGDPPIDCFYVYPTIAFDATGNADIDDEDNTGEEQVAGAQLARFAEVCTIYAPLYRQATLAAITSGQEADRELAYDDVVDAFHHYLGQWNDGRPFVLMGHSQGSGILTSIMADEIDDDPELLGQLVSASLIGSTVYAPPGEDVGGTFQNIPACRSAEQVGCVLSYATYRATPDGVVDGFFGEHSDEGEPLCTNPAALDGGPATVDPIFAADNPIVAADPEPIETGWVQYPGIATVECITNDTHTYLASSVNTDPGDPRPDDLGGDFLPGWGLHVIDLNLGIDALVDVIGTQAEAFG